MIKEKKTIHVNTRHLEESFGVDLHEFSSGEIYPLSTLFDALLPHLPRVAMMDRSAANPEKVKEDSGKKGHHKVSAQSTEIKEFSQTKERI
jgi:hypothetical protein